MSYSGFKTICVKRLKSSRCRSGMDFRVSRFKMNRDLAKTGHVRQSVGQIRLEREHDCPESGLLSRERKSGFLLLNQRSDGFDEELKQAMI